MLVTLKEIMDIAEEIKKALSSTFWAFFNYFNLKKDRSPVTEIDLGYWSY